MLDLNRYPSSLAQRSVERLLAEPDETLASIAYDFAFWGLPHQFIPPHARNIVLWFGGRRAAKTVGMAQAMRADVERGVKHLLIVGRTAGDNRNFIEGPSGLIQAFPPWQRPRFVTSKKKVVFHTGAEALCVAVEDGADVAFKGKGFEVAALDELSTYGDELEEVWKQVKINASIGAPRIYAASNPLPINKYLKRLITNADAEGITVIPCSTFDNFNHLPDELQEFVTKLATTTYGRYEVYPEIFEIVGALWKPEWIRIQPAPDRGITVVAVDPAGSDKPGSDEHGIVCARSSTLPNGQRVAHVLDDLSFRGPVEEWPKRAAELARKHHASLMVIERNRGLDYLRLAVRPHLPHIKLDEITVTRSKDDRALAIAMLYELGRVFHDHRLEQLEEQMTTWVPDQEGQRSRGKATSPDRLDALVHAIAALKLDVGVAPAPKGPTPQPTLRF